MDPAGYGHLYTEQKRESEPQKEEKQMREKRSPVYQLYIIDRATGFSKCKFCPNRYKINDSKYNVMKNL